MEKRNPKPVVFLCALSTLVLASGVVCAEPVGELPPLSDFSRQMMEGQGQTERDLRAAIPSKETVGIPVFPNALYCTEMKAEGMLPTVVLASDESMDSVKTW